MWWWSVENDSPDTLGIQPSRTVLIQWGYSHPGMGTQPQYGVGGEVEVHKPPSKASMMC